MTETVMIAIVGTSCGVIQGLIFFILADIRKKLTDMCEDNRKEHDELFTARRLTDKEIEHINTIHRQKGCDKA